MKATDYKKEARYALLGHTRTAVLAILIAFFIRSSIMQMTAGLILKNPFGALAITCFIQFVMLILAGLFEIGLSAISLNLVFAPQAVSIRNLFAAFRDNADTAIRMRAYFSFLDVLFYLPANCLAMWLTGQGFADYYLPVFSAMFCAFLLHSAVLFLYNISSYLFLDFPDLTSRQILRRTRRILKGNYGKLLRLYISFIPQYILAILSLGIGFLWVDAYTRTARAAFYKDLLSSSQVF